MIISHRGSVAPSHLLFVDDMLLFYRGTKATIITIHRLLEIYGEMLGQCINKEKSNLYLGKHVNPSRAKILVNCSGFHFGAFPFNYLGVPLFRGALRKQALCVVDKIKAKFSLWMGTTLSTAG
ncbi:hypothetical protein Ddye_000296 [Dipteronia dyeriana]|uniref:Reverse transcriptase domain-containing protein n=1 Tax=Dipteronia dyeriana TaxID=168575 RepID=A0AAE0CSE6_9ROSI|nr:hypothetical protein Ddye_000296 [Dipteronia dyeriana]